jgi:hypothetical protein
VRAPRERNPERGGSKLSALITFAIIGSLIFAAFKIAPPYMAKFQLQDAMTEEARFAIVNRKGEDDIRTDIMKKIAELEIPATAKDVQITTSPNTIIIAVHYVVPVDLLVYKFDLDFTPTADSHSL